MCVKHLSQSNLEKFDLFRILYYDCFPYDQKIHNPLKGSLIDFSKTAQYKFRLAFFNALKQKRKVALRLGSLTSNKGWIIPPIKTKEILSKKTTIDDLTEKDILFDLRQKGTDIKIGLDIAAISLKKLVNQIILVSADSDFVPAAKFARREGIDFILDPMWGAIKPYLREHIDGLQSTIERPPLKKQPQP